jgi:hypothetical protein
MVVVAAVLIIGFFLFLMPVPTILTIIGFWLGGVVGAAVGFVISIFLCNA